MKLSSIPNAICILRILLVGPFVYALFQGAYPTALVLIFVAGLSDGVDGFLARQFDWRSQLGSLLDPAADKLLVISAFLSLTSLGLVPLGLTLIVVLRDVVIVSGALAYRGLSGSLRGEPTFISKMNTACQLLFIFLTIVNAQWQQPEAFWLISLGATVIFTSITSGLTYILVWSRRAQELVADKQ